MNRLLSAILILIAAGLFFGYVQPTWTGDVATAKARIASYDSALNAAERFSENEAMLETKRSQIPADELDRLYAFLPDSVNNVELILDLDALAKRSGITLSNFTTSEVPNDSTSNSGKTSSLATTASASPIDSLTLSVSAVGSYDSFRSFLAGIEQSLRPLDVEAITVSNSETGVYTYTLTLKFYWLH